MPIQMPIQMQYEQDQSWMKRALQLAKKGVGRTHPNPRVGAVVVQKGEVVGEGWHHRAGEAHAEVNAIADAKGRTVGATIYVTLEPCSASGRTPPCTQAILDAGIQRVVFASYDANPKMAGGGALLAEQGIAVLGGLMQAEADALNRPFFHYLKTGLPWVLAKAAISLDGKLATHTHDSKWITGSKARQHVHRMRAECDAIVVGAGTLREDNPSLTVRDARLRGKPPLRVVMARQTPEFFPHCALLSGDAPTRIYVQALRDQAELWQQAGVDVVKVPSLEAALRHLAKDGCLQVMVEGGGRLHAALFEAQLAHELLLYQAPRLIGGRDAVNLWHGVGICQMVDAPSLPDIQRKTLGEDQLIRGRIRYPK